MTTKIKIDNVTKIFGKDETGDPLSMLRQGHSKDEIQAQTDHVVGVSQASLDIEEGEIFVVMGLSGSGKSTLIRCVNRLVEPTAGSVIIDGVDVLGLDESALQQFRREKTGMVFQHFALFPHQDVVSNVAFGLKVKGMGVKERVETARKTLELVGLTGYENSFPGELSGGMQQRVGLARALATEPDILLMDEAFSALDPLIRRQMQDELMTIQSGLAKRNTILFITHDLNEALRVGSRVCIMKDGAIHQIGTPEDILMRPETSYVAEFVQDVDQGRVLTVNTVKEAAASVPATATAAQVIEAMNAKPGDVKLDAAHVVDGEGRPLGVVSRADAETAVAAGTTNLAGMIQQTPVVDDETMLAKVYQLCGSGLPLAVVDGDGRLNGSVRPLEVLAELGRVESISQELELSRADGAQS